MLAAVIANRKPKPSQETSSFSKNERSVEDDSKHRARPGQPQTHRQLRQFDDIGASRSVIGNTFHW